MPSKLTQRKSVYLMRFQTWRTGFQCQISKRAACIFITLQMRVVTHLRSREINFTLTLTTTWRSAMTIKRYSRGVRKSQNANKMMILTLTISPTIWTLRVQLLWLTRKINLDILVLLVIIRKLIRLQLTTLATSDSHHRVTSAWRVNKMLSQIVLNQPSADLSW